MVAEFIKEPRMTGNSVILQLDNVSKSYDGKVIINDINIAIRKNELCSVVGPSGCGKSTLLRLVLGQEKPTTGTIKMNKDEIGIPDPDRGIVYQLYSLFPHLTVIDNITYGLRMITTVANRIIHRKEYYDEGMTFLNKVGLSEHAHKYPHQLSGGQRQRVAIAQAFIMKPKVLLMDEPFGALDPGVRESMQVFLLELWEEFDMTIFFVTHDLAEAAYVGTRVLGLTQYYDDGTGCNTFQTHGARIISDYYLSKRADPTSIKTTEAFASFVDLVRQECFVKDYKKYISKYNNRRAKKVSIG